MSTSLRIIQSHGRCTEEGDHDIFFSERPADLAAAQAVCRSCDVRVNCLEVALSEDVEWGVWGGYIFWDGQPFHRRRGRGRPRHDEAGLPLEADKGELLELVRSA